MRIINVTILENEMKPDSTIAGMAGDNLNTKLSIEIPESWAGCTYRLKFKTSNQPGGYAYVSDAISLTSGKIEFLLPSAVMVAGKLWVQSVAEKASGSDTVVVNSATMVLDVGRSIGEQCNEYGFPPNYSGLIDQTLNEINDEITTQANIAKTQAENSAASATAAANSASTSTAQANRAEAAANRAENIDAYTKDVSDTRYSNALTGTASGAMAHMTDVGIGSLRRLAVLGETAEAGTGDKGPDNPYAVAGLTPTKTTACGKNLLLSQTTNGAGGGITWTVETDRSIRVSGTTTSFVVIDLLPQKNDPYIWLPQSSYTASGTPSLDIYFVDEDGAKQYGSISAAGIKIGSTPVYGKVGILRVYKQYAAGSTVDETVYPYIGLEPNQPYQPYIGDFASIPALSPLYGDGDIKDEYDAATGIETRRWKRLELDGTENWALDGTIDSSKYRMTLVLPDILNPPDSQTVGDVSCTHYPKLTAGQTYRLNQGISIAAVTAGKRLMIYDSTYNTNDVSAWKSWLAAQKAAGTPVTVVYQLAEPVVTQRDPARVIPPAPVCNVYADQGDVDVTYNRDINMAFAALETAMKALLGGA